MIAAARVHAAFVPSVEIMYPEDRVTGLGISGPLGERLEAASRPGHFNGVALVVTKLLVAGIPDRAYFGQKDAQQVDVIRRMVHDLDVPVKLVVVPTVRDPDGVALSSRNRYLSPRERAVAVEFARLLQQATKRKINPAGWLGQQLRKVSGLKLDYVELAGDLLCVAVFVGKTRLIDNERVQR
jgi:pantoate--beta-alanine ligase